jgi:hypothetical protein
MKRFAFIPSSPAPLEERITLSHSGLTSAAASPAALAPPNSLNLNLYGFVLGSDTTVGPVHRLQATGGTISPLGSVSLTGFLVIPIKGAAKRAAHGIVTVANDQGTVKVSLRGMVTVHEGSFSFASGDLSYRILSGTEAYHGATGSGPVLYGPGPVLQPGRFLLDFGNAPPPP